VLGFWPPAPSCLTFANMQPNHHHHHHLIPPSPSIAILHGAPKTEPHWLGLNIFLNLFYFISFLLISIGSVFIFVDGILLSVMYSGLCRVVLDNEKIVCLFCRLEDLSVEEVLKAWKQDGDVQSDKVILLKNADGEFIGLSIIDDYMYRPYELSDKSLCEWIQIYKRLDVTDGFCNLACSD
jgi:hypothetical protein